MEAIHLSDIRNLKMKMSDSKNAAWIGKAASLDGKSWCYRATVRGTGHSSEMSIEGEWLQIWNATMKIYTSYFNPESIRVAEITPEKYYTILQ